MATEAFIMVLICWLLSCIVLPALMGKQVAHYEDCTYLTYFDHPNLHPLYATIRGIILIPFTLVVFYVCSISMDLKTDWYAYSGLFYIASALSWSLFYNGVQYEYRKRLSGGKIYKKGFFDKKVRGYGDDHNDAQFNPGFGFRLFMFIIGSASVFTILRVILDF